MELNISKDYIKRLEKAGLAATAILGGVATVIYLRNNHEELLGYIIGGTDKKSVYSGIYTDSKKTQIKQLNGHIENEQFIIDATDIEQQEIELYETTFVNSSQNKGI